MTSSEHNADREACVELLVDLAHLVSNGVLTTHRLEGLVSAAKQRAQHTTLNAQEAAILERLRDLSPVRLRSVELEFLEDDTRVVRVAPIGVLTKDGYR